MISEWGWGHQPYMQTVILLSTQFAELEHAFAWSHSWPLCSQLHCEDCYLCGTFVISSALVKSSMHLHSIFQNFVITPALKMTQFCIFHTDVHLFVLYIFSLYRGILERKRDHIDGKSHCLSMCIHTSHLELFIQPPEKNKNCVKNYFRESLSSDCTSSSRNHISLLPFTANSSKELLISFVSKPP